MTRYVARVYQVAAEAQRTDWMHQSWSSAPLNEINRATLLARADAYMAFLETPLSGYEDIMEKTANG